MKRLFVKVLPLMVILSLVLSSCALQPAPAQAAALEQSATPVPTPITVLPPSDDVWDRIVANKKMVVGTSWDYPPFASVDSNFQVVGYDIAILQEISKRLNIVMDIHNYTFEGLPNALRLNQIDLAWAAISITPERLAQMSFSPIYYVNQTAILARADSQIPTITKVNQLVGYRVGVQRGTTYQKWVQRSLVDTGAMPASKLLSYMTAEDAVRDLEQNRVDLVVIGQATASYYNSLSGLRMVGIGFDQQNLAGAMRLGSPRLNAEIERVMNDMLTDGTILRLIQQYIQEDVSGVLPTPYPPALPTPTPVPPVPTAVPPACVDGMKFVIDVSYFDNNMKNPPLVNAGNGFFKIWRLQNSGTCTWTPNYHLVYAYGNTATARMNGQTVAIPGNVAPGETVDVGVNLTAPQEPYTYQGFWQMENAQNERFGQVVWVGITTQSELNPSYGQPAGAYCQVTLTRPTQTLTTSYDFDTVWTVKNVSGKAWDMDSVDYKFITGAQMHRLTSYDLRQTINNGESGTIIVDMLAPATAGIYTEKWALVSGSVTLCVLMVTVKVK